MVKIHPLQSLIASIAGVAGTSAVTEVDSLNNIPLEGISKVVIQVIIGIATLIKLYSDYKLSAKSIRIEELKTENKNLRKEPSTMTIDEFKAHFDAIQERKPRDNSENTPNSI